MTRRPGAWLDEAAARCLAEALAELRLAAATATDLPLATPTTELAAALNRLNGAAPMTEWTYKQTEPNLWTVGYYEPGGHWEPESDHDNTGDAAARVRWLSGGPDMQGLYTHGDPDRGLVVIGNRYTPAGEAQHARVAAVIENMASEHTAGEVASAVFTTLLTEPHQ